MRDHRTGWTPYRVSEPEDREINESVDNPYVLDRSQRRLFTLANLLPRAMAGYAQVDRRIIPFARAVAYSG